MGFLGGLQAGSGKAAPQAWVEGDDLRRRGELQGHRHLEVALEVHPGLTHVSAYDRNAGAVEQNMVELVERVMDAVNRNLVM